MSPRRGILAIVLVSCAGRSGPPPAPPEPLPAVESLIAQCTAGKGIRHAELTADGRLHTHDGHTSRVRDLASGMLIAVEPHDASAVPPEVSPAEPPRPVRGAWAVSPDGAWLAAAEDNDIVVSNLASEGAELRLRGHGMGIVELWWSPDGAHLVSSSRDRTAALWDPGDGRLLRRFVGHHDAVTVARLSADGTRLATGSGDQTVRVWNAASGQPIGQHKQGSAVTSVAFDPSATHLVSVAGSEILRIDPKTGARSAPLQDGGCLDVAALGFSNDGHRLFVSGKVAGPQGAIEPKRTSRVVVWDGATSSALRHLDGNAWSLSEDQRSILTGPPLVLTDVASGEAWLRFDGDSGRPGPFLAGGTRLITQRRYGGSLVWDLGSGEVVLRSPSQGRAYPLAASTRVVSLHERRAVVWDVATGDVVHESDASSRVPARVVAGQLVTSGPDGALRLTDPVDGRLLHLHDLGAPVRRTVASADDKHLVALTTETGAHVLDMAAGAQLHHVAEPVPGQLMHVALSNGAQHLLATNRAGLVRLWSTASSTYLDLPHPGGALQAAAFSPDGARLATGAVDGVRIWDVRTGEQLAWLLSFDDRSWLAIEPTGRFHAGDPETADGVAIGRADGVWYPHQLRDRLHHPELLRELLGAPPPPEPDRRRRKKR